MSTHVALKVDAGHPDLVAPGATYESAVDESAWEYLSHQDSRPAVYHEHRRSEIRGDELEVGTVLPYNKRVRAAFRGRTRELHIGPPGTFAVGSPQDWTTEEERHRGNGKGPARRHAGRAQVR